MESIRIYDFEEAASLPLRVCTSAIWGRRKLYVESMQLVIVRGHRSFPPVSKQMDILHDLLPESDLVSLHCPVTNETLQILNFETLQHRKARASIMSNGGSDLAETNVASQRSSG